MPFTDSDLARAMSTLLVDHGVMSAQQLDALLPAPTDLHVRQTLPPSQLHAFGAYWKALGEWLAARGGALPETRGIRVPGRAEGPPRTLLERSLYDDAFLQVTRTVGQPRFDPVKAVANHLRFIANRR